MRILVSNDDGVFAPGIAALAQAFTAAGHEVVIVAPDRQRSAASHSLTLFDPLTVRPVQVEGAARAYAVSGTPADCVKLGLYSLYPEAEFVLSGINHGYNAGTDVIYSGTVAAAMEGALSERPAIAVSLAHRREDTYDRAAAFALAAFEIIRENPLPQYAVLNLNYPAVDCALGVKAVPLKPSRYDDHYREENDGEGGVRYHLGGGIDETMEDGEDDYSYLRKGYATMTVLSFDMTDRNATWRLKESL